LNNFHSFFQINLDFIIRIPANFKTIVLQTIARYGNESDWFDLFNKAKSLSSFKERMIILKALTHTQEYNLLKL
jgi:hypothetical protein